MIGQLTKRERQLALVILGAMAVLGFLMMVAGRNDPLGAQGGLVALMALFAIFGAISDYFSRDAGEGRLNCYYDEPNKGKPNVFDGTAHIWIACR
jgi:cytochrome c oxidase cbb3-type subunit I